MPSIDQFRQAVRSGIQRQHRFRVIINFPEFAATQDVSQTASLLARTTSVPASTLGVIEIPFGGRILPTPGDRQYEEWPCTFLLTHDQALNDGLERWHEGINGSDTNTGLTNLEDFARDIQLDLLDAQDKVIKTYILKDAWPTRVGQIDLDAGATDSFAQRDCTFRYTSIVSNTTR